MKILKEDEKVFKIKMGGDEGTILKHKVKDKENHLTNKKPIHDILIQDRIPILWIETKQAKIPDLFKCISLLKYLAE